MSLLLLLLTLTLTAPPQTDSYLERMALALEAYRPIAAEMTPAVDAAAARLADGGRLWAAGQPSVVSEISGRAGGIMMLRNLGDADPGENDTVLYFPEVEDTPTQTWPDACLVIGISARQDGMDYAFPTHADETGLSETLSSAIPAWLLIGELVAALTRRGVMPVLYETIGGYGGYSRMAQYKNGEIPFHDDRKVPPVPAGTLANRYIDTVAGMCRRVLHEEAEKLERAGEMARKAHVDGKQRFMYSMGHLFPNEVVATSIGEVFQSATWNAGFHNSKPEHTYGQADFVSLIGYQHSADDLLDRARPAGANVVYVTLHEDRDYRSDPNVIWIDPMWEWADGCVGIEGYDIPFLAASGLVNGAIAWEIHRQALSASNPVP